jgi:uncharacterized protein DUF4105
MPGIARRLPPCVVLVAACLSVISAALVAQQPASGHPRLLAQTPATNAAEPGSELTVYLLTMGPGDQVWEKFGHNAIWIHDAASQSDVAYHWGVFDFRDKDFYPNFIRGKMRYLMGAFDFNETIDVYRQANRTVWAQELNLTPAQRYSLAQFVAWNVRPENRYYHYDYYRDNCSTRVRDAIDGALGGVIKAATQSIPSHTTYRFHTERLTQDDWPIFTGTMAGLGEPTDREISAYEEMFLPVRMKDRLRNINVTINGMSEPLVKNERVLVQATRPPEDVTVRRGMRGYLIIGIVCFLLIAAASVLQREGKATVAISLAAVWSLVAGFGGFVLTFLWGFTDHIYSYRNENLLQLDPLSLVLLVLLLRLAWTDATSDMYSSRARSAFTTAAVVAALSVIGLLMKALPVFDQGNADIIAMALPIHLAVLAALYNERRKRVGPAATLA